MPHTTLTISGDRFLLDGEPTLPGRSWRGRRVEGLLPNARLVQAIFDDRNPATRSRWGRPEAPWDAERNTDAFIAALPAWQAHGLRAVAFNIQGGSPEGYSDEQPWENPGYAADGTLLPDYAARLDRVLDALDRLGLAAILGLFYFGQVHHLRDEAAVLRACDAVVDHLLARGDRHVIIEIANECDNPPYRRHPVLAPARTTELIERVRQRSGGRLPAGTSFCGGVLPPDAVIAASDVVFFHGNGAGPARIRELCARIRASPAWRGQPLLCNEDDHEDFDAEDCNLLAALDGGASWGHFDWRRPGEPFAAGFQSLPCSWAIDHPRKRAWAAALAAMTGSRP